MAEFVPAFDYLLESEDPSHQFADVPDNKGRAIAGINSLAWPQDYAAVKALPQAQRAAAVAAFYQSKFWVPMKLEPLASQDVANRVLDQGVNGGMREAVLLLQRAVNAVDSASVTVDGWMGPATIAAANAVDAGKLLDAYREARANFYQQVVEAHPEFANDRDGWRVRAEK